MLRHFTLTALGRIDLLEPGWVQVTGVIRSPISGKVTGLQIHLRDRDGHRWLLVQSAPEVRFLAPGPST